MDEQPKDSRTVAQYEASKRYKNTKYWAENYGLWDLHFSKRPRGLFVVSSQQDDGS